MGSPSLGERRAGRAVIGVTGHRRLRSGDQLRARVREALEKARHSLGSPDEIVVLSLLAEGADTVVAEEALRLGLGLEVVLPMRLDAYRRTFTLGSLGRFDALLSSCAAYSGLQSALDPPACYRGAARLMLERSDVLVAVWDGGAGHGVGGTADVVGMAHEMGIPVTVVGCSGGS